MTGRTRDSRAADPARPASRAGGMSRRGLFKLGGAAAAGLALSGCAIPGLAKISTPARGQGRRRSEFWPKQKPTGQRQLRQLGAATSTRTTRR